MSDARPPISHLRAHMTRATLHGELNQVPHIKLSDPARSFAVLRIVA
jgi:hypothetical protein